MEILVVLGIIAGIVLAILAVFAPWFLYRIHCNVKEIRKIMERKSEL